tara:strand:- start:122 stop:304 length:183 start_codon:yes stop_codon:yes gene_type:complete
MNTPRKNSTETTINKGVELMLRRATKKKTSKGLKILQTFVLLKKLFSIRIEFTWEDVDTN